MTLFWQATAGAIIAVVLGLCLDKQGKDLSLLLTVAVCTMLLAGAVSCLRPVMDFLAQLQSLIRLEDAILGTLLKIVGIGILSEITVMICMDAGRASLGKSLQILSTCVVLVLSIPVFQLLIDLLSSVLEGI